MSTGMKSETEGFLFAVYNQSLSTPNRQKMLFSMNIDVMNSMKPCSTMWTDALQTAYLKRHKDMARCFYFPFLLCLWLHPYYYPKQRKYWKINTSFRGIGQFTAWGKYNPTNIIMFFLIKLINLFIEFSVPFDINVINKIQEEHGKYADHAYMPGMKLSESPMVLVHLDWCFLICWRRSWE